MITITLGALLLSAMPTAQGAYKLDRAFTQRVQASFVKTIDLPGTKTGTLTVLAHVPPSIETQQLISATMTVKDDTKSEEISLPDENDSTRSFIGKKIDLGQRRSTAPLKVEITYVLDLYKTALSRGLPVSKTDKRISDSLKETSTVDFSSPKFQDYLKANNLSKAKRETALEFAFRAYGQICLEMSKRLVDGSPQEPMENWKASYLSQPICKDAGCGMCAIQYVAAVRASEVPARLEAGRWALDEVPGYGQFHVRTSIYDRTTGWVPVDPAFGRGGLTRRENIAAQFGKTDGNFITFHLNTDVAPKGLKTSIPIHQFEIVHYEGPGPYRPKIEESWKVRRIAGPGK